MQIPQKSSVPKLGSRFHNGYKRHVRMSHLLQFYYLPGVPL